MYKIVRALEIAFKQHKRQKRKVSGAPYIIHVLDVAKYLLSEPDISEDVVIAGILHDTFEDTNYAPEELEQKFGRVVLNLVQFVTEPAHTSNTSKQEKMRTWKARKQNTIYSCKQASREELLILLADKLSNLQSIRESYIVIGESMWEQFNASKREIEWYYRSLRDEFKPKVQDTKMFKIFDTLVDDIFGT